MFQVITTVNNATEKSYIDTLIPNFGKGPCYIFWLL